MRNSLSSENFCADICQRRRKCLLIMHAGCFDLALLFIVFLIGAHLFFYVDKFYRRSASRSHMLVTWNADICENKCGFCLEFTFVGCI